MDGQNQDAVVRGNLISPEQVHLDRLNELESRNAVNPPSVGIGIGISRSGAAGSSAPEEQSAPNAQGENVLITTPALQAQRETQSGTESVSASEVSSFTWEGYFHAIGLLLLSLVLLWFLARLVRRFGKGRFLPASLSRDELFLEGNLPLGPNRSVCVVRFLDRRLVLGVTDQQINYLTEAGTEDFPSDTEFTEFMENTVNDPRGSGK